jgi:signal transduction histidine kinase/ActR/RegA family two-component response regulator
MLGRLDSAHSALQADVRRGLIDVLYRQSAPIFFGNFAVAALAAGVLRNRVETAWLAAWTLAIFALTGARVAFARAYLRRPRARPQTWGRAFAALSFLSGCLWGSIGVVFFVPQDPVVIVLLCVVLAGMTGGSVASLSSFLPAYYGFALPAVLPFAARSFAHGGELFAALGVLALFLLGVNLAYARTLQRTVRESLQLRFENTALVRELTLAKERAEAANVGKSKFLAAASHDLRQPLHALGLFLQTLREAALPEAERRALVHARRSMDAMEAMFSSLLDVSRLDAQVVVPRLESFALQPVFERARTELEPLARAKGLRMRIARTRAVTHSDPLLLERIVLNLVSNAVRHTARGAVLMGCRRAGAALRVEVRDSGPGIPPGRHAEIFDEFTQLNNPERDRDKGLGLGLAIVSRLAGLLGHRVALRSAPGKGSTFSVTLPRGVPPPEGASRPAPEAADVSGMLVAVVDDDAIVLEAMTGLLAKWGCTTVCAASGAELLASLAGTARVPDLLLCDYRLRGSVSGIEAVEAVREEFNADIAAAIITGDTGPERLREVEASGLAILHKPVNPATLRALLAAALQEKEKID